MPSLLNVFAPQEEDATVWAPYSSAQFDQGAGRHACNNPYNALLEPTILENALKGGKVNSIAYKDFLDLVAPSFGGVEDTEDMAAIFARTHLIVLTDKGVYWRLAGTDKEDVQFIPWPDNQSKDLLVDSQKPIFQAYKKDPEAHALPANFHEDSVWSQELLRKLLSGEEIPRTVTVRGVSLFGNGSFETHRSPRLLPESEMRVKVKQEQVNLVFQNLKRHPRGEVIELDSPSPVKRLRSACSAVGAPRNPDSLPGLDVGSDDMPEVGQVDDLQLALESVMDEEDTEKENGH